MEHKSLKVLSGAQVYLIRDRFGVQWGISAKVRPTLGV